MAELIFERTCNYWIDAGIVGLYDTLKKPAPLKKTVGIWDKTIQSHAAVATELSNRAFVLRGEEKGFDLALSCALEWIRTALYDISTEKQMANPENDGRIKKKSTVAGELVASGKQAQGYTYFNQLVTQKIETGEKVFFPVGATNNTEEICVFCGQMIREKLKLPETNKLFAGTTEKSSPFLEGISSNLAFHSSHKGSKKCWKCGFSAFFAPLLIFYRRKFSDKDSKDTYYILPYMQGNLKATYMLYRSLSGKRGLARVLGADHTAQNYESAFAQMPLGLPPFTLSFYCDMYERILPKFGKVRMESAQKLGLIDDHGAVFHSALFLKRDSGQKSFILRETTVDRSAYFIKLFTHLAKTLGTKANRGSRPDYLITLQDLMNRAEGKRSALQRLSVLRATQALTEGKHLYRFLLPILSSNLKGSDGKSSHITNLFQVYDQWLFRKEDTSMANLVEHAKNAGWGLSKDFWQMPNLNPEEKENLIKRYYYSIERSPSPVKFLEQARHAYKRVNKLIPKEMVFHKEDGCEDIKTFEVYRVYFLAGMLNGLISQDQSASIQAQPEMLLIKEESAS